MSSKYSNSLIDAAIGLEMKKGKNEDKTQREQRRRKE